MKQKIYEYLIIYHQGYNRRADITELQEKFKISSIETLKRYLYKIQISMEYPNVIVLSKNEVYICENIKDIKIINNELMNLNSESKEIRQIIEWKQDLFRLFHNA